MNHALGASNDKTSFVRCYHKHLKNHVAGCIEAHRSAFDARTVESFEKVFAGQHQKRIPCSLRREVAKSLLAHIDSLLEIESFEKLIAEVGVLLTGCGVKSVPSLWAYDISLIIGYFHKGERVWPTDKVYLYQGAYNGARTFLGRKSVGHLVDTDAFGIDMLDSVQIESMMCMCHDCMLKGEIPDKCRHRPLSCGKSTTC